MGGLWSVFKKVVPIITLVCFICLGITHTFQQVGADNITYLSTETYDKETWEKIENPTPQEQQEGFTYYKFDTNTYMSNFNVNYLKNTVQNLTDLSAFTNTLAKFNKIWEDGYQIFDGIRTLVNGILLIFNGFLTALNIGLMPVRIISALFLTAFTLVGINISNGSIICATLIFFCNQLAFPLINPANSVDQNDTINNTNWRFNNNNLSLNYGQSDIPSFYFTSNNRQFTGIKIISRNEITYAFYDTQENATRYLRVFYNNQWISQEYRYITITDDNSLTTNEVNTIIEFLYANGDIEDNSLNNTYWQFNTTITNNETTQTFYFYSYTDYGTSFYGLIIDTNNNVYYIQVQNGQQSNINVYSNNGWVDSAYRNIHIANQTMYSKTTQALRQLLSANATQIT